MQAAGPDMRVAHRVPARAAQARAAQEARRSCPRGGRRCRWRRRGAVIVGYCAEVQAEGRAEGQCGGAQASEGGRRRAGGYRATHCAQATTQAGCRAAQTAGGDARDR